MSLVSRNFIAFYMIRADDKHLLPERDRERAGETHTRAGAFLTNRYRWYQRLCCATGCVTLMRFTLSILAFSLQD